jgi:hypothetical protein
MPWRLCGRCGTPVRIERLTSIRRYCARCQHLRDRPTYYAQRWRALWRLVHNQVSPHSRTAVREQHLANALFRSSALPAAFDAYRQGPRALRTPASPLWHRWPARYGTRAHYVSQKPR